MKFEHLSFDVAEYRENGGQENGYKDFIILLDDNVEDEASKIVAQAISLDIRGDFGFFLNRRTKEKSEYNWNGNLFNVVVIPNRNRVEISNVTGESNIYSIALGDWKEALLDWKEFYLGTLGFLEFNSRALSHVIGVLILTYDQMADKFCDMEMITEAIKRCSERYGVDRSVIYRDCKKVTSLYNIRNFYYWVKCLLENMCGLCYDDVIYNIDIKYNANVKEVINKRLGIALK